QNNDRAGDRRPDRQHQDKPVFPQKISTTDPKRECQIYEAADSEGDRLTRVSAGRRQPDHQWEGRDSQPSRSLHRGWRQRPEDPRNVSEPPEDVSVLSLPVETAEEQVSDRSERRPLPLHLPRTRQEKHTGGPKQDVSSLYRRQHTKGCGDV